MLANVKASSSRTLSKVAANTQLARLNVIVCKGNILTHKVIIDQHVLIINLYPPPTGFVSLLFSQSFNSAEFVIVSYPTCRLYFFLLSISTPQ